MAKNRRKKYKSIDDLPDYFDIQTYCQMFGGNYESRRVQAKNGIIPAEKKEGRWVFHKPKVIAYINGTAEPKPANSPKQVKVHIKRIKRRNIHRTPDNRKRNAYITCKRAGVPV